MLFSKRMKENSTFLLCWLVYFTSYIGRLDFPSVMAQLIQLGKLTASQAGTINMAYFFAYGMGQILNGFLGDRLKAKHMIFCGLFCSGIINGAMIFASNYFLMTLLWFFNGIFQSMIWPPLIRTLSERPT
ncbi:MFS transporter [uncultured Sphaerochaeta sp.]|uniref:MFS transporter n=1 Tax=uncultured Sphaerochaeta sp. TaxID=886478 RepID=UPI002A0A35AF|nr:MFS transporter [uncultured Sphaerochaeta sp.]